MSVPQELPELVERFHTNREAYRSGQYNETQLRREFIDPLFQLLGWDVNNEKGYAEAYKDVIHEDSIKIGGLTKAPDYCFRIGGVRKFFVETKRPSVNIKEDIDPAFQLRRYAWSAKLPLSILTDFEEFAVYDCRVKPSKTDKASTARIMYVGNCAEFTQNWDALASVFSREAVLKGSFDRYAESSRAKKGTAEVDTAFLTEIESWRDALARNLALRNPDLSQRDLNFAVQRTIDRIIFLRICEDRGIERYGQLMALQNGDRMYKRLCELFYRADERYNSGLFHFQKEKDRAESPDTLTPNLGIDDGALRDIIKNLYYPDSPYEFSVLSADILGQVYEQFLGKVIRLTAGHRAVVEEKPEVRKAGGIYYTPTYIVDYIVKNTVGKLVGAENFQPLRKTTPKEVSKIRILDPACGSGSFLLGAYQYLLDWHRDWYVANNPEKWATGRSPALYQSEKSEIQNLSSTQTCPRRREGIGNWRLTTAERRRILLNNIYGVDIDRQAVEVTKLSLLLKVLEGESEQTIVKQLKMFHERALPDLSNNIKCGNSLIGTDFYHTPLNPLFLEGTSGHSPLERGAGGVLDEERYRINPFDWDKEFPEIMKAGGFDVVIGNPPWGANFSDHEQKYLRVYYKVAQGSNIDSYAVFTERSLSRLKTGGLLGYITPDTFLRKDDHVLTRKLLLENTRIIELIETGPVFSKVRDTWCLVFTVLKIKPTAESKVRHKKISRFVVSAEERLEKFGSADWDTETEILQSVWRNCPKMIVGYLASEETQRLIAKTEKHPMLEQLSNKYRISRGEEGSKFALKKDSEGKFFIVVPQDIERYAVAEGLSVSANTLTPNKLEAFYKHPKIWIIRIQKMRWKQRIVCGLDNRTNSAGMKTLQVVVSATDSLEELKYLVGILASSLINIWCVNYLADDMNQSYLQKLPIRTIDFLDLCDKARYDKMVSLVDQMLSLHKHSASAKTDHDKTVIQRQIDAVDHQIDQLVYELYGLTEEEIKVVEGILF